ncbi:thiol reductant ABC exporter subunit CydD [Actinocrispum wychmicini]|uniref:ATP-binding cassette subfamily C protein CydCD n=1 Tax=Actinocrispum wychmicini TaxID=1213861 RepID=A0A4R2JYV0_9PSEU|nr:thiol reductant ABC exporter subunit CydD [Actinocrispum wychmicini]TCO64517.1 ATP-binding cassette subfamily C protein CydCD [Actinocrispum wychmicini]
MSSPSRGTPALNRPGSGPLGALPSGARRALATCVLLSFLTAMALVAQAWSLSSALTGHGMLWVLAVAVVARALLGWATQVVAARAAAGAKEELRASVVSTAMDCGPEWITEQGPASLTVLATKGLDALDGYFTSYLPALVNAAVVPVSVGAAVLFADWPSAVVVAVTLPLVPVFAILIGLWTKTRVAEAADASARLSAHMLELIRALPVLTAFRRASAQAAAVRRVSDQHRRTTLSTLRAAFASALVLELVATLSVAVIAVIIGVRLVSGELTLSVGLFVLILAPECYFPLRAAGAAHHASEDGLEAVRRVHGLLGPRRPVDSRYQPGEQVSVRVKELRVARRAGFAPDGISFELRPGELVRLDSASGSGKSTTIAALLGFVRPDAGSIEIDGCADDEAWRRIVAWVPQRPAFACETVADELRLAVSDRNVPPTVPELREVADLAVAGHLLERRVIELSTGERQRVAIARALLRVRRGARVLLLDEPTAQLDSATAGRVMAAIHQVRDDGVAVLLATHRKTAVTQEAPEPVAVATSTMDSSGTTAKPRLTRRMVFGALLGAFALASGVALTATSAWLIAKAAEQPPILTLSVAIVGVRTFGLARAGLRYAERLVTHDAAFRAAIDLRVRLWDRLVALGPARTAGMARGEGLRKLVDDVDTVRDLTPRVLVPPLVAAVVCGIAVTIQAVISPVAGLALAVAVLLGGIGAPWLARTLEHRATLALAENRRQIAATILALLEAAPELIVFGADRQWRADIEAQDAELTARARRQAFGAGAATALITLVTGAAAVVGAASGNPVLALVPLALVEVLAMLPPATQHRAALYTAYTRLGTLLDETLEPHGQPNRGVGISLKNVDVRWPGAVEPSLRDVTLDIPAGAHVAVLGPSGAGKSTLLALLLGFLPAERGVAQVPERVAWCPQEPQLVSTTIRENLRLGDPHACDEQLADALTRAGLGRWRSRLGERVGPVSGGEADRLALARALVAVPHSDLVVLDEPTAHLDVGTARTVLAGLAESLRGRTLIHVTHRPEEAVEADMVIRVAQGRVA